MKNQKNKVFKGFSLTLGYGFGCFCCLVFPKVFTKPKNHSRKSKILKKTKENQKNIRKYKKNNVFKGFSPTLGYGFVFFSFFGFPEGFYKTKKSFDKIKYTKENQRKPKKH